MTLDTPIKEAGRVFSMYAKRLEKLNITTIQDLVFHIPHRYEDYSHITSIADASSSEIVTIQGTVLESKNTYARRGFQIQKITITDETGTLECIWFNQSYITKNIHVGDTLSVSGRVERMGNRASMQVKDYEVLKENNSTSVHTGTLVAIYPETRGVSSKWIRNRVKTLLPIIEKQLTEYLPSQILQERNLLPLTKAMKAIHFPTTHEEAERARTRLAYDELFLIQLTAIHRRNLWREKKTTTPFDVSSYKDKLNKLYKSLPFTLTSAQMRAIDEILQDVSQPTPMNRLLQGDVGSGKTVVAAVAMYLAHLNGFQSALMAPTEILANQHFKSVSQILEPLGIKIVLLTGNTKKNDPDFDIAIGTHALIHGKLGFEKLGLVVIDEQHRFGVEQRAMLREKGNTPHFLSMTATPIPRTIFLTMYGDLELSILDELPKGRKQIKTWLVPNEKRINAYDWIKKQILTLDEQGNRNQVFIVCPFIEESESMQTVRAALKEFEYLKKEIFPDFTLGLLHGKMKAKEKDEVLHSFQQGKIDILVSTPVVEVGIDIPNATIILIEAAERFGLASLHQLRGRVGRSDKQSYCLLFTESPNSKTTQRLKALETTHTGSALAEIDLRNRGAGDMYGTLQHGTRMLKIANFSDTVLIHQTQQDAQKIYQFLSAHPMLQEKIKSTIIHKVNPD